MVSMTSMLQERELMNDYVAGHAVAHQMLEQ